MIDNERSMPSTARINSLVGRTVGLLRTLLKCDAAPEKLKRAVTSLEADPVRAMGREEKREQPMDDIICDFSEDIANAVDSLINREVVKRTLRAQESNPTVKVASLCVQNRDDDAFFVSRGGEDEEEVGNIRGAWSHEDSEYKDVPSVSKPKYAKRNSNKSRKFECEVCGRPCSSKWVLNRHKMIHLAEEEARRPHRCDVCDQRFLTKQNLQKHKSVHLEGEAKLRFKCEECEKGFALEQSLKAHKLSHLPNDDPRKMEVTCDICGLFMSSKKSLQFHKGMHLDVDDDSTKTYECEVCGRRFAQRCRLKEHKERNMHGDAKPAFACGDCEKRFIRVADLQNHSISHLPDSDPRKQHLLCNVCGKFSSDKYELKRHRQIHLNDRNPEEAAKKRLFKCEVCGLALRTSQGLRNHTNTHDTDDTVRRPYECGICYKRFTDKGGLQYHENSHLAVDDPRRLARKRECDICGMILADVKGLKMHKERRHSDKSKKRKKIISNSNCKEKRDRLSLSDKKSDEEMEVDGNSDAYDGPWSEDEESEEDN